MDGREPAPPDALREDVGAQGGDCGGSRGGGDAPAAGSAAGALSKTGIPVLGDSGRRDEQGSEVVDGRVRMRSYRADADDECHSGGAGSLNSDRCGLE